MTDPLSDIDVARIVCAGALAKGYTAAQVTALLKEWHGLRAELAKAEAECRRLRELLDSTAGYYYPPEEGKG